MSAWRRRILVVDDEIDPSIPVLMVTVNTDNALAAEAIASGAFSYLAKPFNLKYLEHLMAAAWSS